MPSLSELIANLEPDPWRKWTGFSNDIDSVQDVLFGGDDKDRWHSALNEWVENNQPCLFGKMAAKLEAIRFCVVDQPALDASDKDVFDTIQDCRFRWRRDAVHGKASAFVIVVASPALSVATPNDTVRQIAIRIASLYLNQEVEVDQIYQERVFLETPGARSGWMWRGGVDYFAAHGDQRWWHDHRFPGGIAFSVNSLGHFVRCAQLANALDRFDEVLGIKADDSVNRPRVENNARALEFALRTIKNSTAATSGKAASLQRATEPRHPRCPVVSRDFDTTDTARYTAYYDTDFTLRSEFFRSDIERPADVGPHTMDFTYLYDDSFENQDHTEMMRGVQYKGAHAAEPQRRSLKARLVTPEAISAETDDEFKALLG